MVVAFGISAGLSVSRRVRSVKKRLMQLEAEQKEQRLLANKKARSDHYNAFSL